jgi:Arf-GAP/coiled-coil/ANK repeat/PH domain-containing protein
LVDELLQITALSNIEAKKKFEFLEAVSGSMDAHLRYFKQVSFLKDICGCLT